MDIIERIHTHVYRIDILHEEEYARDMNLQRKQSLLISAEDAAEAFAAALEYTREWHCIESISVHMDESIEVFVETQNCPVFDTDTDEVDVDEERESLPDDEYEDDEEEGFRW